MSHEQHGATLLWHRDDGTTVPFPLADGPALVGREGDAPIQIEEPLVSRNHAEIAFEDGHYVVRDLGSTNRTRVNGLVVTHSVLADGDEILFARARCTFLCREAPAADESVPQAAEERSLRKSG